MYRLQIHVHSNVSRLNNEFRDVYRVSRLVAYFCYHVAYGAKETCPGLMDESKCLIMENTPYQYGFYDGKNAGLMDLFNVQWWIILGKTIEGVISAGMITPLQAGGKQHE